MRTIAALLFFVSTSAFACPNLAGSFTCSYADGSSEVLTISQAEKDGVTMYNYNGSAIPADNQLYNLPDDANLRQATFRAWCESTVLKGQIKGKYYNENAYYGDLEMTMNLSLEGNNLKSVTTGALTNSAGSTPLEGEIVCVRN